MRRSKLVSTNWLLAAIILFAWCFCAILAMFIAHVATSLLGVWAGRVVIALFLAASIVDGVELALSFNADERNPKHDNH